MPTTRPQVAGIDLEVTDALAADEVAATLARHARGQGAEAAALVVGVHRVLLPEPTIRSGGALAFSLRADGLDAGSLWAVASEVAQTVGDATGAGHAVVLGRRRQGAAAQARRAEIAAREHEDGTSGRAVAYRGDDVVGAIPVADVRARTVIDDVLDLAGATPGPDDYVLLRDPARPRWQFGSLVLHVLPAPGAGDGAVFVPVEALRGSALAS